MNAERSGSHTTPRTTMAASSTCRRRNAASRAVMWGLGLTTAVLVIASTSPTNALALPKQKVRTVLDGAGFRTGTIPVPTAADDESLCSLQMVHDSDLVTDNSEQDFELHVGRALDTLRADYPHILTKQPDFSIYDAKLEVVDPSGVKVHGITSYKNAFRFLNGIVQVIYCPNKSIITFRMVYDKARRVIRIHWNAKVVPREIFGGSRTTLHVDGISVYEMDRKTGKITQHRIEQLLMNNTPVRPKEGVYAALKNKHVESVPSFNVASGGGSAAATELGGGATDSNSTDSRSMVVNFQQANLLRALFNDKKNMPSSLFAMEASGSSSGENESSGDESQSGVNLEAFNNKNKTRKKYGLKALTIEEFLEVEADVKLLDTQQRAARASASSAAETSKKKERQPGFLEKMLGSVLEDTCESNYDCQRPEVCCDFKVKKMCCASGQFVINGMRSQSPIPVRVPLGRVKDGYPEGRGPNDSPQRY